jgi:TolB-like protein
VIWQNVAKPDTIPTQNSNGDRKLESWKEIAAFFGRDLRTVIRWEKDLALPVHRYPGKSKGRIYALVGELEAWAESPRRTGKLTNGNEADSRGPEDGNATGVGLAGPPDGLKEGELAEAHMDLSQVDGDGPARPRRWLAIGLTILLVAALAGATGLYFYRQRPISSVAVLPFDNLSGDQDSAFVEGLTDEISASLSRLAGVRVAGRRSAFTFQGKRDDLKRVGSALGVEAVVEGSVQREGNQMHVAVQLNRTNDGFTVWSQTFDGSSRDQIQIETEIATAVARQLSRDAPAVQPSTSDPEARALYLQGRYLWNQRTMSGEQKSVEYMQQAIAKDPNYALAWSGLAESLMTIGNLEEVQPGDYLPKAKEAAQKALQIDPNLAEAHAVLGRIAAHYDYDWATAEREYKKAFALNPSYATAHQYYALGLMAHGRFAEAQKQLDIAQKLDPLALVVGVDVALLRKFQRDYNGVITESERVLSLDPNYRLGYSMLMTGYLLTHRYDDWRRTVPKAPQDALITAVVAGNQEEARRQLAEQVKQAEEGKLPAYRIVWAAAGQGDRKLAVDWLQRSYQNGDYWLLFMNVDPQLDPIRNEPEFQAMAKKLGVG